MYLRIDSFDEFRNDFENFPLSFLEIQGGIDSHSSIFYYCIYITF